MNWLSKSTTIFFMWARALFFKITYRSSIWLKIRYQLPARLGKPNFSFQQTALRKPYFNFEYFNLMIRVSNSHPHIKGHKVLIFFILQFMSVSNKSHPQKWIKIIHLKPPSCSLSSMNTCQTSSIKSRTYFIFICTFI